MDEAKQRRNKHEQMLFETSEALNEKGLLVMGGFAAYRKVVMPEAASPEQVRECAYAFMAGAQHLFGSMMTMLDPGDEPTAADERRMGLIFSEMEDFTKQMAASHYSTKGSA